MESETTNYTLQLNHYIAHNIHCTVYSAFNSFRTGKNYLLSLDEVSQ